MAIRELTDENQSITYRQRVADIAAGNREAKKARPNELLHKSRTVNQNSQGTTVVPFNPTWQN